jgi:hypothetical protein
MQMKWSSFWMGVVLFVLLTCQVLAAPQVVLNDKPLTFPVPPTLENDRVLVPLRAIFEALGATVSWDGVTQTVSASKGEILIRLQIGSETAYKNDQAIKLDVPGKIIGSSTMVPLRFVSEALGAQVGWLPESETVTINQQQPSQEPSLEQIATALTQEFPTYSVLTNADAVGFFKDEASLEANTAEYYVVQEDDYFVIALQNKTAINFIEPVLKLFYPTTYKWVFDQAKTTYAPGVTDPRLWDLADKQFDGRFLWFSGRANDDEGQMNLINMGKIGKTIPEWMLKK